MDLLLFKMRPSASKGDDDANEGGGVEGGLVVLVMTLILCDDPSAESFFCSDGSVSILAKDSNVLDKDDELLLSSWLFDTRAGATGGP